MIEQTELNQEHQNPHEFGKPLYFNVDQYLDAVEGMICADEIETALYMLDHLPGYYRDHYPSRAQEIRNTVYRKLMNVHDYVHDYDEVTLAKGLDPTKVPLKEAYNYPFYQPRAIVALSTVKRINEMGFVANIHEMGPAYFWLPVMLNEEKCDFAYTFTSINAHLMDHKLELPDPPILPKKDVFISFETIEHLWNPDEIYQAYLKSGSKGDYILLSTPKYTAFGGMPNWRNRQLGHIRTYTPKEFTAFAIKHWPNHSWRIAESHGMMALCGSKNE